MDNSDSRNSLICRHQAATRKATCRSNSARRPFQAATLVAASAIASCVSGLSHVTSSPANWLLLVLLLYLEPHSVLFGNNHIWWGGLIRGIKIPQQELEPKMQGGLIRGGGGGGGGGGVIAGFYGIYLNIV